MKQIKEWLSYQLNDSTAKKLDDRPFPLFHISYFNILEVVFLNKVSNLSAQQRGSDSSSNLIIESQMLIYERDHEG